MIRWDRVSSSIDNAFCGEVQIGFIDYGLDRMKLLTFNYGKADKDYYERLFSEWVQKAGLMPVPDHCGKCNDSGYVNDEGEIDGEKFFKANILPCPDCSDNHNSLFNYRKEVKS